MTPSNRSEHLREVADLLWPAPLRWELGRPARRPAVDAYQELVVVPSAADPRLLVPTDPRAAAAALLNSQSGSGRRERVRALVLATVFRLGLGSRLFRDRLRVLPPTTGALPTAETSLKAHLDRLLHTDGSWALPVTRARANRKPVLQVLSTGGEPVAFVKVGTNELTRQLVRSEQRSLTTLAPLLATTRVPEVLASSDWQQLALLALSPLPLRRRASAAPRDVVTRAAVEIFEAGGLVTAALGESAYWHELRKRLTDLSGPHQDVLLESWEELDRHAGRLVLPFGSWHGDWAPWNMAWADDTLLVWDLERFAQGVPAGLDLVHLDLQTRILDPAVDAGAVIDARREDSPNLLEPVGVSSEAAFVVFAVYLLEIACRWVSDQQEEAGGAGGILGDLVAAARRAARRAGRTHTVRGR